jgi:Ca2+/Na+ antiporter
MIMGQLSGITGAVVGGLLGLLSAAVAAHFMTRGTKGPREKALMVKTAILNGGVFIVFFALLLGLPSPYGRLPQHAVLLILCSVYLVIMTKVCNRRRTRIREAEAQELAQEQNVAQPDAAQDGESAGAPPPPVS